MATVRQHTCGAEVVQNWLSPGLADSLAFFDRRGFDEITHCPRCGQRLDPADLNTVRPFVQGDPLNYAPEGGQGATTYHAGVCSGCGLPSEALSPGGHCVNCSILDRTSPPGLPF